MCNGGPHRAHRTSIDRSVLHSCVTRTDTGLAGRFDSGRNSANHVLQGMRGESGVKKYYHYRYVALRQLQIDVHHLIWLGIAVYTAAKRSTIWRFVAHIQRLSPDAVRSLPQ